MGKGVPALSHNSPPSNRKGSFKERIAGRVSSSPLPNPPYGG